MSGFLGTDFRGQDLRAEVGGLVAVKHALKTDAESYTSVPEGGNVVVDGLTITHTMADANNRLIISAYFGAAANSNGRGAVGIAVADDGVFLAIGDAGGNRSRVGAGGNTSVSSGTGEIIMPSVTFVHEPGDTDEHEFTVHAFSIIDGTRTLFINRNQDDADLVRAPRTTSGLVIQEVSV